MNERENPDGLADELERQAARLQQRSAEVGDMISDTRDEWERKRADESVPGAPPRQDQSDRDAPGDQINPEDAQRNEHESPQAPERADARPEVEDEDT